MSGLTEDGKRFVIETEPDMVCEYCGKVAETCPYGRNGARICHECGMKPENKKLTEETFKMLINDVEVVVKADSELKLSRAKS